MKFKIVLKDPDGIFDSIEEAVEANYEDDPDLSDEENNTRYEERVYALQKFVRKNWVAYGDYVVIEFDTEAETATVEKVDPNLKV